MPDVQPLDAQLAKHDAQSLDLRFTDLLGAWRHLSIAASAVAPERLDRLCLFDGSAVPGWRDIVESDLMLLPDPGRAWADPFTAQPTLTCIADVVDPATKEGYERCPRSALKRTLAELASERLADTILVGADLGFHVFDRLDVNRSALGLGFSVPARTAGGGTPHQPAYLAGQPQDDLADLRAEMTSVLASLGVRGLTHLLLRGRGQCELRFGPAEALEMADQLQLAKYVVDNVARAYGKVASFIPLPLPDGCGSGLHLHLALKRDEQWLFAGRGYADLSDTCLHAIGGLLRHTPALNALTNPSTNSYRRLQSGRQEPALLGFGARNRSTAIRIPAAAQPEDKRIELRFPDPLANSYLALAGIALAMRDGIHHAIDPGEPVDRNVYDLGRDDTTGLERCAPDFKTALGALEGATQGLFATEAVPAELLHGYIALKRAEIDLIESQPHPMEHAVYGL